MPRTGLNAKELYLKALDAAEEEIRRNGVERLKLTDVARGLGVSHAALYNHFTDKEAMLDAVSKRWLDRIDQELAKITVKSKPAESRLTEWFLMLHKMKREKVLADPKLYGAFNMSAAKTRPFVQAHLQTTFTQLEQMISEGMASGEFKCKNAAVGAQVLFEGTAAFHHPRIVLDMIDTDRVASFKALLKVLLAGLKV